MPREWLELLDKRNRTSKTKRLYVDGQPTNKFSWDGNLGLAMHYLDAETAWQDVDDSAEEPDTDGFTLKFTKLSYFGRIDDEGRRRFYPDRNDLSYWIEFKKPYPNMGAPTRQNRWFYWDFAHATIGVRFDVDSLKFGFRLKDNQAPTSITIPFETQGITRQGRLLLHDGEVVAELRKPIATGSNLDAEGVPVQKECDVVFGLGEVIISLDPTGLEYPIEIDPTVDKQVGAGADDCESVGAAFTNNNTAPKIGDNAGSDCDIAARFTNVNVANGVTIDVCYASVKGYARAGDWTDLKAFFEDADDPGQIANEADFNGRALTAGIHWDIDIDWVNDVWYDTPTLKNDCQTVVDRVGWAANQAMMVFIKDDGSGWNDRRQCHTFDTAAADAPKLHIEYTAAAAGVPTLMDNYHRRRVVQG